MLLNSLGLNYADIINIAQHPNFYESQSGINADIAQEILRLGILSEPSEPQYQHQGFADYRNAKILEAISLLNKSRDFAVVGLAIENNTESLQYVDSSPVVSKYILVERLNEINADTQLAIRVIDRPSLDEDGVNDGD